MNMLVKAADRARWPNDPKVQSTGPSSLGAPDRLARGLGWFSIGLGLFELLEARSLARGLGLRGREWLIRGFGAREIAAGVLTLSNEAPVGVASRIAGDGLDIVTLLAALHPDNPRRGNAGIALAAVLGVTALDVACQAGLAKRHRREKPQSRDYRDRSGFPNGLAATRGAARQDAGKRDGAAAATPTVL